MCAGKLLNLIKKCLHREKSGHKSEKPSPGHKSGQRTQPGASKKRSSPRPTGCCTVCHHHHYQQPPGVGQLSTAGQRSGYQRLCPSPRMSCNVTDPCHCSGVNCYVTSPVAYMPGMPMDHIEQEVALQRERQIRFHAVQTDMELNLPPAIRISKDGEEGYLHSQRLLQLSWTADRRRESICPPPNKTVYQGDSPPPYRSNSVGKVDGHCMNGKRSGTGSYLVNKLTGSGTNSSPRISSHCPSNMTAAGLCVGGGGGVVKRPYGYTSHGRLTTTTGSTPCTPIPVTQPCCHHHNCHGSQLPISHLSQSLHSYGTSQQTGPMSSSAPAGGGGGGTPKSRACPNPARYSNPNSPIHHQHHSSNSTNQNDASSGCHNALHCKAVAEHGYYGPPPDYSEMAPTAAPPLVVSTVVATTTTNGVQQLQSDSHV
ncbi:hypothetical protein LSH36_230g03021 [Paralvinella palmiformis]|uniref:Uncharacterized protein n=1 Tax=Paralvinella palmiformis TaxID=53620 RepID=A0AAD9JMH5_9ANNE|nr:hypothetical protein LSH36_230g03021 [Paralvinella palmiformis]